MDDHTTAELEGGGTLSHCQELYEELTSDYTFSQSDIRVMVRCTKHIGYNAG